MAKQISMLDDEEILGTADFSGEAEEIEEVSEVEVEADEVETVEEQVEEVAEQVSEETASEATETEVETPEAKATKEATDRALEGRLGAIMDEREKRRKAEQELEALRKQMEALQPQQQAAFPDPVIDPQGYHRAVMEAQQEQIIADRVETSIELAVAEHGEETVAAAQAWAAQRHQNGDVFFTNQALKQRAPMKFVVAEYEKAKKLEEIVSDEDAYFEKMARAKGWAPVQSATQATAAPAAKTTAQRKPTLAEMEGSKGGSQEEPPLSMLDL